MAASTLPGIIECMTKERIRKMTDAIQRSRAIRAESQRRREDSRKLMLEAERLLEGAQASRLGRNDSKGAREG